jgi:hypothetical protein
MGADAPIPPNMMNAAAPDGAPPRRSDSFFCSIEIIEKTLALLGAHALRAFSPRRSGIPPYNDNLIRSTITSEMGVKGVLPLGCLPHWGREGVTLLYAEEDWQVTGKRVFLQSRFLQCIFFILGKFERQYFPGAFAKKPPCPIRPRQAGRANPSGQGSITI